jgi:hypothetical protein
MQALFLADVSARHGRRFVHRCEPVHTLPDVIKLSCWRVGYLDPTASEGQSWQQSYCYAPTGRNEAQAANSDTHFVENDARRLQGFSR